MVRHTKTTVKAPISLEVEAFFIFTFASYLTHRRTNTFALIFKDLYFYYKSIVILHFGFIILIIPEE